MKIVSILLCFILLLACKLRTIDSNASDDIATTVCPYKSFTFNLSDSDTLKIGFPSDENFEIGPSAMAIDSDNIYFLDPLFSKVRAIQIEDGRILSSISFSNIVNSEYSWIPRLYDLAFFNNKLYVLDGTDTIKILSKNLELESFIKTGIYGSKYFYSLIGDTLQFYSDESRKLINIDTENKITEAKANANIDLKKINNTFLGHDYQLSKSNNKNVISTEYGSVILNEEIQNITLYYYQCKNFAFALNYFVHFKIDKKEQRIVFYLYCFE